MKFPFDVISLRVKVDNDLGRVEVPNEESIWTFRDKWRVNVRREYVWVSFGARV